MPQFNKAFHLGKMNKDMDERVVPNGEYRDAMNIQVQTSDGSDSGAAQTLMGNVLMSNDLVPAGSTCVGSIASNKDDKVYYLVAGPTPEIIDGIDFDWNTGKAWKDYIIEYDIKTEKFKYVFVDIYRANYKVISSGATSNPKLSGQIQLDILASNPHSHLRGNMLVEGYDSTGFNYITQRPKGSVESTTEAHANGVVRLFSTYTDFTTTPITPGSWLNFTGKRVLNFHKDRYITGINIVDGMLFWTDNHSEPKKINIKRSIAGTGGTQRLPVSMLSTPFQGTFNGDTSIFHTRLCITPDKENPLTIKLRNSSLPWYVKEENITVIRKGPLSAPVLKMATHEGDRFDANGDPVATATSTNGSPLHISGPPSASQNSFTYTSPNGFDYLKRVGESIQGINVSTAVYWKLGDTIIFNQDQDDDVSVSAFTEHDVRCTVTAIGGSAISTGPFEMMIESIDSEAIDAEQKTWHLRLEKEKPMFEFKFPRFAYRYKYEDGEYSTFSPWSEPAFIPGPFDYLPKKAFNLGMTNRLRSLSITNYVVEESLRPQGVVAIDLLYKDEASPNVYTVETIKMTDGWVDEDDTESLLLWPDSVTGTKDNSGNPVVVVSQRHRGEYRVTSELIHATVPSNQLLRQWDNVPRKALAQEVTSNRLVYGNYLQNYDLVSDYTGNELRPKLLVSLFPSETTLNATNIEEDTDGNDVVNINKVDDEFQATGVPMPHKTVRSLREYQVGVVYGDEYGRETPVLAGDGSTGSLTIPKMFSSTANKLRVQLASNHPSWAKYFKFFVKETSNEYYNMAMDRWYNAEDGNIWLSFPSADRNKVDDETFIILKKRHDTHQPVDDPARYKVIAIENSAPDFIKTNVKTLGTAYNNTARNHIGSSTLGFPLVDYAEIWFDDGAYGVDKMFGLSGNSSDSSASFAEVQKMINEGTCYIRVRTINIKSEWYQVTKGVLDSGRYKFTIDGVLKEDVEFASSNGSYSGAVSDLRIELSNHKVENKKEFEGRFFVKIYKDLVLLQNLLLPAEKKYKVKGASKIGYWNMPSGKRAEHASNNNSSPNVNWESFAVNCKAEFNAHNSASPNGTTWGGTNDNNGFRINGSNNTANDRMLFFYTVKGIRLGPYHSQYNYARQKGTRDWCAQSTDFFHICASWVRAPREESGSGWNTTDDLKGGRRGRGIFQSGGKWTMDIGYVMNGTNYNMTSEANVFYKQITTTGTTFRFREDPDGVVYKVTNSNTSGQQNSSPYNTNGLIGQQHMVNESSSYARGNNKLRFSVTFDSVDQPGTVFSGPKGYNILGGKSTTKINGVKELGYWGGRHTTGGFGGGGDDNDMTIPLPPDYVNSSASAGAGVQMRLDDDGNIVSGLQAIQQARLWRQHPSKYHHIEIVEELTDDEDFSSENPAIWETEPKEDVGMDIYYEASDAIPIEINSSTNELFAPFGTMVNRDYNQFTGEFKVAGWDEDTVTLSNPLPNITSGARVRFTRSDGFSTTAVILDPIDGGTGLPVPFPTIANNVSVLKLRGWKQAAYPVANAYYNDAPHNQIYTLSWFNAYAFGNGIESDRIRDDYNQSTLANGVKASTVLAEQYKEEHRKTGLIHSGIYNSTSGINRLNQFIAAEKITKDMNPSYGSIQKLHTRDSNIVVLHEDKCMKVLANKDALYNADGGKNVAISANFLGSDQPFATRYGISTNPESCATDLHGRLYFADRTRGAVLRLSNDGITNISDYGMKDWFGDNLGPLTQRILGSYDEKKGEYNVTIKGLYPVGNSNNSGGENGEDQCGCASGDNGVYHTQDEGDVRNLDNTRILRSEANLNVGSVRFNSLDFYKTEVTLSFSEKAKGWISFKSFVPESGVSINNEYYTFKGGEMYKHHASAERNTFYKDLYGDAAFTEASVTLLFNDQPSTVKSFSTLNYEGSQARIKQNTLDGEYYNLNSEIKGWYVGDIKTNLQESSYLEFKNKEGKWFTSIKGDTTTLQNLDEREFSVQGIGNYMSITATGADVKPDRCLTITPNIIPCVNPVESTPGCTDPTADNYSATATIDDGSCTYPPPPPPPPPSNGPGCDDNGSCVSQLYVDDAYYVMHTTQPQPWSINSNDFLTQNPNLLPYTYGGVSFTIGTLIEQGSIWLLNPSNGWVNKDIRDHEVSFFMNPFMTVYPNIIPRSFKWNTSYADPTSHLGKAIAYTIASGMDAAKNGYLLTETNGCDGNARVTNWSKIRSGGNNPGPWGDWASKWLQGFSYNDICLVLNKIGEYFDDSSYGGGAGYAASAGASERIGIDFLQGVNTSTPFHGPAFKDATTGLPTSDHTQVPYAVEGMLIWLFDGSRVFRIGSWHQHILQQTFTHCAPSSYAPGLYDPGISAIDLNIIPNAPTSL